MAQNMWQKMATEHLFSCFVKSIIIYIYSMMLYLLFKMKYYYEWDSTASVYRKQLLSIKGIRLDDFCYSLRMAVSKYL